MNDMQIGRGWTVFSADRKRIGDVVEVHPHFILVSRGVLLIKDMYLPLGTVERVENGTVVLTVTNDALRKMDLSHEPPPPPEAPETAPETYGNVARSPARDSLSDYPSETGPGSEPLTFPGAWSPEEEEYEETPSYNRPLPNGLVEVEHTLNLAYSDLGYGMPIVLMQGWPFDSTIWEPIPYELALYNRVITFDARGSGDSDKPWDFYSIQTLTQDLHRLVVEQGLHNITLVAWSTSAEVALSYAQEHPKRLARLILISPLIPAWLMAEDAESWLAGQPGLDRETIAEWQSDLVRNRPALFDQLLDRLTVTPLEDNRRRWILSRMLLGAQNAQIKLFEALLSEDPTSALYLVKTPVTILQGLQDRIAPFASVERLASLLPSAQITALENCGHAPFLDASELVAKILGDLTSTLIEPAYEPTYDEAGTMESEDASEQPMDENPELVASALDEALLSGEPVKALPETEGE